MNYLSLTSVVIFLQACTHHQATPVPRAKDVDLSRFIGDWYVIANIPTFLEKGAHNAVESYAINEDGSIATTFSFNQDDFDGALKVYRPTGYVSESNTSEWAMQFIWPFKAEYVITYLSEDYQHTIIARSARDYVWIMSRSPQITTEVYDTLIQYCIDIGYKSEQIIKVPHQIHANHTEAE